MLVDAHTHLDHADFDLDRDAVMARARRAGVREVVVCASDPDRWATTARVGRSVGAVVFLGLHPWVASETDEAGLEAWLAALAEQDLDGVGEIGLDTLHARSAGQPERQRRAFRAQLAFARERRLPVVLHGVRAYPELLATLERDGLPDAGVLLHGWSGPPDQVARAARLGLYLSFGPLILHDRARKARASAALAPVERLLIETDCPTVTVPGETRGEPAHLVRVLEGLAELRGVAPEALARTTSAAFDRFLGRQGARGA